jgi:GAF domain-containing protein
MTTVGHFGVTGTGRLSSGSALDAAAPLLVGYLDDVALRTAGRLGEVAGVAVTLRVADEPVTMGSSSALALDVDLLQYSIGLGPCLHALQFGEGMYVPDLAQDDRWKDYGPRAAALGAASCVSAPVLVAGEPAAVIKVYSAAVDGLSAEQRELAAMVAVEISGGIALAERLTRQAWELDDRVDAMDTRRVIDLAIGILMERSRTSASEAFDLVRRYSQQYNIKLREAASQIVTGVSGTPDPRAPFRTRG